MFKHFFSKIKNNMSSSSVLTRIRELHQLIHTWNREYYFEQAPTVSDATYDQHYRELVELEQKYPQFQDSQSPTQQVGYWEAGALPKIVHQNRLLSLKNAFEFGDVVTFDQRVCKITQGQHNYLAEPKIDGLSLSLVFKKHRFSYAATRGNGRMGENVTTNVYEISNLKSLLSQKFPLDNFELRGEVYLSNQNFAALNARIAQDQTATIETIAKELNIKISKLSQTHNFFWAMNSKLSALEEKIGFICPESFVNWNEKINRTKLRNQLIWKLLPQKKGNHEQLLKLITSKIKNSSYRLITNVNCPAYEIIFNFSFKQIPFLNPRNVASGSLRQLDSKITRKRNLDVLFYELIVPKKMEITRLQQIAQIKKLGFPCASENKVCLDLSEIKTFIQKMENHRNQMSYPMDGIVIKVNQKKFDHILGENEKTPNYALAFKFPAKVVETRILDIFPTVGRTGRITYNAKLQKIYLEGSVVGAATLHNADFIEILDIRVGDLVAIKKAGDIIPRILKPNKLFRLPGTKKWKRPSVCSFCQMQLIQEKGEIDQYCSNLNCSERQIRSLIYFVSLEAMNIFGLSEQIIRAFWKLNLVRSPVDIYKLLQQKKQLIERAEENVLPNFGIRSIEKLLHAIQTSKTRPWSQVLIALGIRYLGTRTARLISEHYPTPLSLLSASIEDLQRIKGIGERCSTSLYNFFQIKKNITLLQELQSLGVGLVKAIATSTIKETFLTGKKIVITGTFAVSRRVLIEKLQQIGVKVVITITSQTDYVLVGSNPGSKFQKAERLGIKIISENQLKSLI